jgi:hypothetical protein
MTCANNELLTKSLAIWWLDGSTVDIFTKPGNGLGRLNLVFNFNKIISMGSGCGGTEY